MSINYLLVVTENEPTMVDAEQWPRKPLAKAKLDPLEHNVLTYFDLRELCPFMVNMDRDKSQVRVHATKMPEIEAVVLHGCPLLLTASLSRGSTKIHIQTTLEEDIKVTNWRLCASNTKPPG